MWPLRSPQHLRGGGEAWIAGLTRWSNRRSDLTQGFSVINTTPVLGGSMRIGIRLGGAMFGVIVTMMGTTTRADSAERVVAIPLGGSLEAQKGDHNYGVYIPTRFGGELKIESTDGK